MPEFEKFLDREESALFSQMAKRDGNDPVYDAAVDAAVKWQAVGFRNRARAYAKDLLTKVFTDADDDDLLDKVISRSKIVSACLSL